MSHLTIGFILVPTFLSHPVPRCCLETMTLLCPWILSDYYHNSILPWGIYSSDC